MVYVMLHTPWAQKYLPPQPSYQDLRNFNDQMAIADTPSLLENRESLVATLLSDCKSFSFLSFPGC